MRGEKKIMNKTISAICPSCETRIRFHSQPKLRDVVVCDECGEELEVVRLSPLKLDWSGFNDEELWSDVDYDDYGNYGNGRQDRYDF